MIQKNVCLMLLVFLLGITVRAQEEKDTSKTFKSVLVKVATSRPAKAGLLSTVIPGAGQIYNGIGLDKGRPYWKVPVIYGLGGFFAYNIANYHSEYKGFQQELFARECIAASAEDECVDENGEQLQSNGDYDKYSDANLSSRKDFYRQQRDANVVYITLLYAANIIDAIVDAHLRDFNVNKQNVLSIEPAIFGPNSLGQASGISVNLRF